MMVTGRNDVWKLVSCIFACELVAIGSTSYSFGLFVNPVSEELGLSRSKANLGMVFLMLGMALASPAVGWLLDRHPPGKLICTGAWLASAGMAAIAISPTTTGIVVALFLLVGPGVSLFGPAAGSTIINRNIARHRGRALGFASLGASFGGIVIAPLISLYILEFNWRAAMLIHALTIAVLLPALVFVIMPRHLGRADPSACLSPSSTLTLAQGDRSMFATRKFWTIAVAVALVFSSSQAILISLAPHAVDMGVTAVAASTLVSAVALSSMLGKLLFGCILDRFPKKWILCLVISLVVVQVMVLLSSRHYYMMLVLLFLTGLAVGGELPVWAAIVGDYFRSGNIGLVMGAMNLANMLANMLLIYLVGVLYDSAGSYTPSFLLLLCVLLVALFLCCLIPLRPETDD